MGSIDTASLSLQSGLHYLALAIGYTIASQVGGPVTDRIWRHLQNKAGGATAPEYSVPLMILGALLTPIGLFWYGWAADARVYWTVADTGASIFGCGIILGTQAMRAYVMDSYTQYTASAMAAAQLLRSIAGFAFPTVAPVLYGKLGYGCGNSILAFAFIAIGVPAPLFLWRFGARIRAKGTDRAVVILGGVYQFRQTHINQKLIIWSLIKRRATKK